MEPKKYILKEIHPSDSHYHRYYLVGQTFTESENIPIVPQKKEDGYFKGELIHKGNSYYFYAIKLEEL